MLGQSWFGFFLFHWGEHNSILYVKVEKMKLNVKQFENLFDMLLILLLLLLNAIRIEEQHACCNTQFKISNEISFRIDRK